MHNTNTTKMNAVDPSYEDRVRTVVLQFKINREEWVAKTASWHDVYAEDPAQFEAIWMGLMKEPGLSGLGQDSLTTIKSQFTAYRTCTIFHNHGFSPEELKTAVQGLPEELTALRAMGLAVMGAAKLTDVKPAPLAKRGWFNLHIEELVSAGDGLWQATKACSIANHGPQ